MNKSLTRVGGMFLRYAYLHKRSLPRTFEIILWPVMELLVWGYVSMYFQSLSAGALSKTISSLINAMIFWDILYRSQQSVSISFVEDIWTQNIVNLLVSPLKIWEWVLATFIYGILKTLLITLLLTAIALTLYHFNLIGSLGLYLVPLGFNLLLFGWAVGIFTAALIVRWGHAAEALIWGIPFFIQPISAVFYPLDTLPGWLQAIAKALPSTYVFEGMRAATVTKQMPMNYFLIALGLNGVYFILGGLFFQQMYVSSRKSGRLGRLGMD